jgi:hypothetical protein
MKLPTPKWNPRAYPFETLPIGGEIFQTESLAYFRTAASNYFRAHPRKTYMTETVVREGKKGVLLTRLEDKPV